MKTIFLAILVMFSLATHGQRMVVVAAGDFDRHEQGSLSWTLGQAATGHFTGSNMILTQGFQQSNLEVTTSTRFYPEMEGKITAYPNPVRNRLAVHLQDMDEISLSFQLFDLEGRLLKEEKIHSNPRRIHFNGMPSGKYILRITSGKKIIKTFKLIKR